ncbi:MAG: cytochrome P450 [Spirochaetaceae bacterium]|nr:cytochrome P450 [Spirochaetaceae bacterium]
MTARGETWFEELIAAHATRMRDSPLAGYFADPFRFFAWARAEAPVLHLPEVDWWAVARYHDIRSVFRDPVTFSSSIVREPITPLCPRATEIRESAGVRLEPTLADEEPATHRRHRRLFGEGLSARRVARLEPMIRAIVNSQIDRFVDDGRADLLAGLLQPAASRITFHLLGGEDDHFDLADWPGGMRRVETWGTPTEAAQVSHMHMVARLWSVSGRLVRRAIAHPGDSYLGDAVRARRAQPALFTDNYLHNVAFLLQTAGADNQSHALANGIRTMLDDRTPWQRLCADPGLIPGAVEEILRFGTPLLAFPRLATRDTEVGGRHLPAGARILLLLASGNRDETVFPDGEQLDIDRDNARDHLSFGHGAHFCLGAPLARLEMKIILEELTRRLPRLRLADGGAPEVFRTFTFRGLKHLTVEWTRSSGGNGTAHR